MGRVKAWLMEQREKEQNETCSVCEGEGVVAYDYPMPHNSSRDVGYLDTRTETCETCNGSGEIESTGENDDEQ